MTNSALLEAVTAFLDHAYDDYAVKNQCPGELAPTLFYHVPTWAIDKLADAAGYWKPVTVEDFINDPEFTVGPES